jgi:hypothetical protein
MAERDKYKHFTVKDIEYSLSSAVCPKCGANSARNTTYMREPIDVGLDATVLLRIKVSVHKCPKGCGYFSICPPFINKGYRYTDECITKSIESIVEDKVSINQTVNRVARDFNIHPAKSTIWKWLNGEMTKVKISPNYEQWVVASFSGVACVDEVYDGKFAVIFMTDPITDTVLGRVVKEGNVKQEDMKDFLLRMRNKGINVKLLLTDESTLYADDILKETLPSAEHGLCNFHLIGNVTKEAIKAVKKIVTR